MLATLSFVIPGRAKREPGIHIPWRCGISRCYHAVPQRGRGGYGFRVRELRSRPGMTNDRLSTIRRVEEPALSSTLGAYTASNGTAILLFVSIHSGTGRFFDRMKSGLNSLDW
jgi:hypothetical protein